ncbi:MULTISPECIES: folylpolyglutamate synthase/dihydrofolate synthase family protein [unclassified Caulobacter]|uniref:bifunctional folylpolyglutamate synthase/dihydrofolate synthase n=1 Tax=unclassified Caulobacter TaxID=2648921 RepID=UPI0006FCEC4B|nr:MULTISPECIES: folylpolyglutamate synthase/dihydrofolate synthase family protein [unclassified Caulobacter]KQV55457.1 bifunctional folylpolyglutamate synthase/dihydrofolate synthase [Caulobacter sp. Root342]KQV71634.1 bifunctional folylpolyglutamate synthase/dihydrofolate synthase [Caulobacter sp. Root343]
MAEHLRAHDAALERLKALHPKLIDLSLDRMRRLCAALGDPQDRLPPVIHVAGTNGKGSTVAYLRAMAEAAGLKVHVFTSPHLVRFAERIRLAGTLITDAHLADVLDRVEAANAGQEITFFEITTAAALVAFAEVPADLCIVEVGLGGILDATNVVTPKVSVIAPVDIDHREFLGDTLTQIAGEKAGIIKPGAPAVSARQHEEAEAVIEAAAAKAGVSLTLMGRDFDAWNERGRLLVQMDDRLLDLPAPSLPGEHQFANAGLAVAALLAMADPRIDEAAMGRGIAATVWPARFQRLTTGPLAERAKAAGTDLWLDGGHNPHAGRAVARAVSDLAARDGRPVALIAGLLANKDATGFFTPFRGVAAKVFTVTFEGPAAASAAETAAAAELAGLRACACDSVEDALERALKLEPTPHVLICGSLYLAGEVLAMSPETWPA